MGEDQEQDKIIQQAVEMALVNKRLSDLESWKAIYEKEQQNRIEKLEDDTNKRITRLEEKIDKFVLEVGQQVGMLVEKINEQKENWMTKSPWWLVTLITFLFSTLTGFIVYFVSIAHK